MSSSIEEYFQPPEWATKEEVIKAAQHYINYWKTEAKQRNQQWLNALEENARLKSEVDALKLGSILTAVDVLQFIKLKAENDRLRASSFVTAVPVEEYEKLKAEVERLKEGNDCLGQMHDKEMERSAYLCEEVNRTTAWGRGLESDLSHARVEISFLKSEVERLSAADSYLQSANEYSFEQRCDELEAEVERLRKAGDAMQKRLIFLHDRWDSDEPNIESEAWNAAKEGKQP